MVHPNEAKVLQLFGKYVGTLRDPGLRDTMRKSGCLREFGGLDAAKD
jgi:hypothetical protein